MTRKMSNAPTVKTRVIGLSSGTVKRKLAEKVRLSVQKYPLLFGSRNRQRVYSLPKARLVYVCAFGQEVLRASLSNCCSWEVSKGHREVRNAPRALSVVGPKPQTRAFSGYEREKQLLVEGVCSRIMRQQGIMMLARVAVAVRNATEAYRIS